MPTERVEFREALRFWVKLGFISFGGPAGQIAIMHRELVERRKWISESRFLHALNYCMLLPGPEAHQLAIYIGWLMHRTLGGFVAGLFFVLPSIVVLLALSYIYAAYGHLPAIAAILSGFKPVVVAIVVHALLKIGWRALKGRLAYLIAAAAFVSIYFLGVPFPLIILAAGVAGLAVSAFSGRQAREAADEKAAGPEDDLDFGEHTRPNFKRLVRTLSLGLLLWAVPAAVLIAALGGSGIHAQQYFFFSKAALVTFGGAYAVLAYITHAATAELGWLAPGQAVDGLALAETTPGPLIMVLQFIGFMAGWNVAPQGMSPAASGVIGALVTTYVTFLPSFIFIFLGAPYIEKLRGNAYLQGALSGITAAVVGVILNLAIVFGITVIFPDGYFTAPNIFAVALTLAAFLALYKTRLDVLWVVMIGGALGLVHSLIAAP